MPLSNEQLETYRRAGHVTAPAVFTAAEMEAVIAEAEAWAEARVAAMDEAERARHLDPTGNGTARLRWIDQPAHHCPRFRALATDRRLVDLVEQIVGPGVDIYFSQIFFKPPDGGSPKPAHQDDYYAGVNDRDGLVTAWIALDAATLENGCLYFGDGTHLGPTLPHFAPADRPFDLQVVPDALQGIALTPAPVPQGGVSFHHVGVLHQSAQNDSGQWRRAAAVTFVTKDTYFANPNLGHYDPSLRIAVS